jgi:hypothetical protein
LSCPDPDPWTTFWSPEFHSLILTLPSLTEHVVAKLIRDSSTGTLIVPASQLSLESVTSIVRVACYLLTFATGGVDLVAIIWDAWVPMTRTVIPLAPLSKPELHRSTTSPFVHDAWCTALAYHPDRAYVTRLLRGIKHGRHLGYTGPRDVHRKCINPPDFALHRQSLLTIIEQQESKSWRSGPFINPPMFNLICSPIKGASKRFSDKIRLVNNMSAPYDGSSINHNIPTGTTRNLPLRRVCELLTRLGTGTLMWVFDVVSAYKTVNVHIDDWHLHGELVDGHYHFSTVPNFGCRSAGDIFDEYGAGFEFALRAHSPLDALTRYVDDFVGFTRPLEHGVPNMNAACRARDATLVLARAMGVPLDKFVGPTCTATVLGFELCSRTMSLSVTTQRRDLMLSMLAEWSDRTHATIDELQSLCGLLSYICEVFRWGKAFLGRCIALANARVSVTVPVTLPLDFYSEIAWWRDTLTEWSCTSLFYDADWSDQSLLSFEVDASMLGQGCWFQPNWYSSAWSPEQLEIAQRESRVSMPFLELYAIATACATFAHHWCRLKIICRSDCEPACAALNKRYSPDAGMQSLIRSIGQLACKHNFDIRVVHIPGLLNIRADPLSRLDVPRFHVQAPLAASMPTVPLLPPTHPYVMRSL